MPSVLVPLADGCEELEAVTIIDAMISEYGGNQFNVEPIKDKITNHVGNICDKPLMERLVLGQDYHGWTWRGASGSWWPSTFAQERSLRGDPGCTYGRWVRVKFVPVPSRRRRTK